MSHPPNFNPLWRRALGRIGLVTNAELERAENDLMRTNHNLIWAERRLRDQANELTELRGGDGYDWRSQQD
jgi:hypothetical protein